jgi:hypothetical protein
MRRRESGYVLSNSVGITSWPLTARTRREIITLICWAFALSPEVHAQEQTRKVHRIGYLTGGSPTTNPHFVKAFREGLREHGWVESENIIIEYRHAEGQYDRLAELADELVRQRVEVIVATPTAAAVAAAKATATIPIVMRGVGDPIGLGLAASLARPGGNVTGLSYTTVGMETIAKGLEFLKQAVPNVRVVAILSNPANPVHVHRYSIAIFTFRWWSMVGSFQVRSRGGANARVCLRRALRSASSVRSALRWRHCALRPDLPLRAAFLATMR